MGEKRKRADTKNESKGRAGPQKRKFEAQDGPKIKEKKVVEGQRQRPKLVQFTISRKLRLDL